MIMLRVVLALALLAALPPSARATFDVDGVRYLSPAGVANGAAAGAIALQPDGRLLVAGTTTLRDEPLQRTLRVQRFHPDGSDADAAPLYESAHSGGLWVPAHGLLADADGGVVLAYNLADANTPSDSRGRIIRIGGDQPFQDFTLELGQGADSIDALALDRDGRVIGVGSMPPQSGSGRVALVFRLQANGILDTGFASDGFRHFGAMTSINFASRYYDTVTLNRAFLFQDGRIMLIGTASNWTSNESEILFARLRPDGSLDPDFNDGEPLLYAHRDGSLISSFTSAIAADMAPDGTVVIAGRSAFGRDSACFFQFSPAAELQAEHCDDFDIADSGTDVQLLPNGGVVGIGRFLESGRLRSTVALFPQGLAFSGSVFDRFPDAAFGHFLAALAYHPDTRDLIGVGSGVTTEGGFTSERWVLARESVPGALDVSPDPITANDEVTAPAGTPVQGAPQALTGFDPLLRLPLRLRGGSAWIDGVRFDAGLVPQWLLISRDEATPALPLVLEHVAGNVDGEVRETILEAGGLLRLDNHRVAVGARVGTQLRSVVGTPLPALLRDGFETR